MIEVVIVTDGYEFVIEVVIVIGGDKFVIQVVFGTGGDEFVIEIVIVTGGDEDWSIDLDSREVEEIHRLLRQCVDRVPATVFDRAKTICAAQLAYVWQV